MATANTVSEVQTPSAPSSASLLVFIAPMAREQMENIFAGLTAFFPAEELVIATPNDAVGTSYTSLRVVSTSASNAVWPLAPADFVNAYRIAKEHEAKGVLILGPGADSLHLTSVRNLATAVLDSSTDVVIPHYSLSPHTALVNSAILYPLTRSLFGSGVRFPLSLDMAVSVRMAERLANAAQRFVSLNQGDGILWPVTEACAAGFSIDHVDVGPRILPQPAEPNINAILTLVTGSLFADIEAKAALWQRPRRLSPEQQITAESWRGPDNRVVDVVPMVEGFRMAFTNLQEIWSLVLAPNSLLGLKRLSVLEPAAFRMPELLWARIVFDFLVAYRLRTINRGHLLGALIPLYLAWVAGHMNVTTAGTSEEEHIEAQAAAFEEDKPYIVSRWRWPDRFNP
jgi:glucosylglycerate synthase